MLLLEFNPLYSLTDPSHGFIYTSQKCETLESLILHQANGKHFAKTLDWLWDLDKRLRLNVEKLVLSNLVCNRKIELRVVRHERLCVFLFSFGFWWRCCENRFGFCFGDQRLFGFLFVDLSRLLDSFDFWVFTFVDNKIINSFVIVDFIGNQRP